MAPVLVHVLLVCFFFVEEFFLGTTSGRQRLGDQFLITSVALTVAQLGGCPPALVALFFWFNSISQLRPLPAHGPGTCACASALLVSFRGSFQNRLFGSAALTVAQLGGSGGVYSFG